MLMTVCFVVSLLRPQTVEYRPSSDPSFSTPLAPPCMSYTTYPYRIAQAVTDSRSPDAQGQGQGKGKGQQGQGGQGVCVPVHCGHNGWLAGSEARAFAEYVDSLQDLS
jgi:hypothetical protein